MKYKSIQKLQKQSGSKSSRMPQSELSNQKSVDAFYPATTVAGLETSRGIIKP